MRRRKTELDAAGVKVVFLSFSPREEVREFQEELPAGWRCLHDPEREIYDRYGMSRGEGARFATARLAAAYLGLLLKGHRLRRPRADVRQLGGDVAVGPDGVIRALHRSRDPGDRPELDPLVARLTRRE